MVDAIRGFSIIAGAWIRSALTYRTSFVIGTLVQLVITFLDFAAIIIMFTHLDAFGGFSIAQIALLCAMSGLALGTADLLIGNAEAVGRRIRGGSFDQMLVRPVPAVAQVAADRFALRRIGRIVQAGGILTWALIAAPIDWTADRVVVLAGAMVCGAAISPPPADPMTVPGATLTRVDGARQWLSLPAGASTAPMVAAHGQRDDLVDLSIQEPAVEDVITALYSR